jgi:hypothetical protein
VAVGGENGGLDVKTGVREIVGAGVLVTGRVGILVSVVKDRIVVGRLGVGGLFFHSIGRDMTLEKWPISAKPTVQSRITNPKVLAGVFFTTA